MSNGLELEPHVMRDMAVDEALSTLGLLLPSAKPALLAMLNNTTGEHPRAITTAYRKDGEQLTGDELKALGLRRNAFMSRTAYNEISSAGMQVPLTAHMTTLLRAGFTIARHHTLRGALAQTTVKRPAMVFKYDMLNPECATCKKLNGDELEPEQAHIFPPPDCKCETANYAISMRIDFFHDLRERARLGTIE